MPWTSGRMGISSVSVQVAEVRPPCGLFFLFLDTNPAPGGPLHDLETGKMQSYMIGKSLKKKKKKNHQTKTLSASSRAI